MADYFGSREISAVYYGKKAISAIYKGARLVWQAGNFLTSEGAYMRTAEGEMFYCKED